MFPVEAPQNRAGWGPQEGMWGDNHQHLGWKWQRYDPFSGQKGPCWLLPSAVTTTLAAGAPRAQSGRCPVSGDFLVLTVESQRPALASTCLPSCCALSCSRVTSSAPCPSEGVGLDHAGVPPLILQTLPGWNIPEHSCALTIHSSPPHDVMVITVIWVVVVMVGDDGKRDGTMEGLVVTVMSRF